MAIEEPMEAVFMPFVPSVVTVNRHIVTCRGLAPVNGMPSNGRGRGSLNFGAYKPQQEEK